MAKNNFYAVKKGNKTGLFTTWDECKTAVAGFSSPEYKGFVTKEEAEAYLNDEDIHFEQIKEDVNNGYVVAYTDGSFNEATNEKTVFSQDDYFVKENEEEGHSVTWVVPNCQKNDMEPIICELSEGGTSPVEEPHSGEEFGYVLSGSVHIHVGEALYKAKKGDSFYFTADKTHFISNAGKTTAKILWVVTPPSF